MGRLPFNPLYDDLTHRESSVYKAILEFKKRHDGVSPTYREIGDMTSISSTSAVYYTLLRLEQRGHIHLIGDGKSCRIVLKGSVWIPPHKDQRPQ